jgi:hypothetical protein
MPQLLNFRFRRYDSHNVAYGAFVVWVWPGAEWQLPDNNKREQAFGGRE